MFCPNCGKEIPDDTRFCGYCGAKIFEEGTAPEPVRKINVRAEDFRPLLSELKNPFDNSVFEMPAAIAALIAALIANWMWTRSFTCGIGMTLIVIAGLLLIEFLGDRHHFRFQDALLSIACEMWVPAVFLFVGSLLEIFGIGVGFITTIFAVLLFAGIVIRRHPDMNGYLVTALLACIAICVLIYLVMNIGMAIFNMMNEL